jgi:hypothetical protein
MTQPTDEVPDPNKPILDQLDRIEATLDGVAEVLATDAEEPVT